MDRAADQPLGASKVLLSDAHPEEPTGQWERVTGWYRVGLACGDQAGHIQGCRNK